MLDPEIFILHTCKNILHYGEQGLSGGSDSKESAYSVGDLGSFHRLGRPPRGGMATHFSILAWRIPLDRGGWQPAVHGVAESRTQLRD